MKVSRETAIWAFMVAGAIFYAGWISSIAYFKVSDQWQNTHKLVQVETTVVPKLKTDLKQASCDNRRLASVAGQAIVSTRSGSIPTPSLGDVKGCQKVAPVKAPPVSAVVADGTAPRQ